MNEPGDIAQVMGACYAAGAVDLERTTATIGFERKRTKSDTHRSSAVGGQGQYIGGDYRWYDDEARGRK